MERKFDNTKGVMYVITDMEDTLKQFEEKNMMGYLYEEEENFNLKKKKLELALTKYMDRE